MREDEPPRSPSSRVVADLWAGQGVEDGRSSNDDDREANEVLELAGVVEYNAEDVHYELESVLERVLRVRRAAGVRRRAAKLQAGG